MLGGYPRDSTDVRIVSRTRRCRAVRPSGPAGASGSACTVARSWVDVSSLTCGLSFAAPHDGADRSNSGRVWSGSVRARVVPPGCVESVPAVVSVVGDGLYLRGQPRHRKRRFQTSVRQRLDTCRRLLLEIVQTFYVQTFEQ